MADRVRHEGAEPKGRRRAARPLISFAVLPAYGHLHPVLPLAEAVTAASARAQVAVGPPFTVRLPLPTVVGMDADPTRTDVPAQTRARFPGVVDDPRRFVPAYFGVAHALPTVSALRRAWQRERPDLVVFDTVNPGAAVVADELGIPSVLFGVFHYFPPMLGLSDVTRRALDHPDVAPWEPVDEPTPPRPYVDPVPPALQVGPVETHDDVIPIRTVAWDDPAVPSLPRRARTSGRPLVYVTLGTVVASAPLLRDLVEQAARVGDVIVSTGPRADRRELGDLPRGVEVHDFVRPSEVLDAADLVVHHGGLGTTLAAAARAVPQLVVPQVGDQHTNAEAVERAGAGRVVRDGAPADAVTEGLAHLHRDDATRVAAQDVARQIAARPSPGAVAEELIRRVGRAGA